MGTVGVIGGGFGGLASSALLAANGHRVVLCEEQDSLGGKASEVREAGFRFDTGPTLVTMPEVLRGIFADCGASLDERLTLKRVDPICRYFFPDGRCVDAWHDQERFAAELSRVLGEPAGNLDRYLAYSRRLYEITHDVFLFNPVHELSTLLRWSTLRAFLRLPRIDAFRSAHAAHESFFSTDEARMIFDRYATYSGSNPYTAPATLNVIPHVEYALGSYTIEGGVYSLVRALEKVIRENGGEIRPGCGVARIEHEAGRVSALALTSGERLPVDAVVSNADAVYTFSKLLPEFPRKKARLNRLEPSCSGVVFLWGVRGVEAGLDHHNIFFGSDYANEFHEIFSEGRSPTDPTVYVSISSKVNPEDAPKDHENWFVLVNTPWVRDATDYSAEALEALRARILARLTRAGISDLAERIVFERVISPLDLMRRTNTNKGSIYGISSNDRMTAFNRQSNRARELRGLFFAGGSVHPGGGIPLTMLSGKMAAALAGRYLS